MKVLFSPWGVRSGVRRGTYCCVSLDQFTSHSISNLAVAAHQNPRVAMALPVSRAVPTESAAIPPADRNAAAKDATTTAVSHPTLGCLSRCRLA